MHRACKLWAIGTTHLQHPRSLLAIQVHTQNDWLALQGLQNKPACKAGSWLMAKSGAAKRQKVAKPDSGCNKAEVSDERSKSLPLQPLTLW